MPVNLDPALIALDQLPKKGKLMRVDASGGDNGALAGEVLEFQYNPESVTRSRTGKWDPRNRKRKGKASNQEVTSRSVHGASSLVADSETISLKVIFDATEAILAGRDQAETRGILPQLAALEMISLGKGQEDAKKKGGNKNKDAVQPVRPDELLLMLGERVFPAVMTALTITEQKFNADLVPLRAEADIKLNVLEPAESGYNQWIRTAFDTLLQKRREHMQTGVSTSGSVLDAIQKALSPAPTSSSGGNG